MKTPREIINALGDQAIADRLGVAIRRVRDSRYDDRLPASWYATLSDMAGEDLPRSLFTFKPADRVA